MKQCVACAMLLGSLAAMAELPEGVIYRNDFTTRESAGAIPEPGVWHEAQPYPSTTKQIFNLSALGCLSAVSIFTSLNISSFTPLTSRVMYLTSS